MLEKVSLSKYTFMLVVQAGRETQILPELCIKYNYFDMWDHDCPYDCVLVHLRSPVRITR